MKLTKFNVHKYRSIEDSGDIPVDGNITTFVGINESGKTNALRALRKLNNKTDTKFDDLTENPVWHFGTFDKNEIFITATFSLNDDEKESIKKIDDKYVDLQEVEFSRNKEMKLICRFKELNQFAIPYSKFNTDYIQPIRLILQGLDPTTIPDGENLIKNMLALLDNVGINLEDNLNVRSPNILSQINENVNAFKIELDKYTTLNNDKILSVLKKINDEIDPDNGEDIKNFLIGRLPRFIYFENIGVLDSRINLKTLVSDIKNDDLTKEEMTAKTLLDLAKLDPNTLLKLSSDVGKHQKNIHHDKDVLSQMCNQASLRLSRDMDKIWNQNKHDVEIEINGSYLRLWVTNRQDRLRLQLEERSRGYRWYFSFYVVFNVESEARHKNSILLLDEPALFLHALGQEDFLTKVLPKLSEKNQIVYTTHSPFLLDLTRPYSIHTVTLDKESENRKTHISKTHWATDRDALFPLQSAVGYHLAQSMFIGKNNMIVEGLTDFWILKGASDLFNAMDKSGFNNNFVFSPAGGATKIIILAKTYVSQELNVGVILDSDEEGIAAKEKLITDQLLQNNKILLLDKIIKNSDVEMSIEDIFPEEYYLKFVKSSYGDVLQGKDIVLESKKSMIVKRIQAYFIKNGLGNFDKTKPALEIVKEFGKIELSDLPDELVINLKKIFSSVNSIMR